MPNVQSFEVAQGDTYGDLLSAERISSGRKLKIGVLAGAFFEYWPMYPNLKATVEADNQVVVGRLASRHDVVYPCLVDTLDAADEAGRCFREAQIDLLIIAERTYVPDAYVHQTLSHLAGVPLLLFVSQSRDEFDLRGDYEAVLRNSGLMSLVQLVAGFRKMGLYPQVEVVVGSIRDEQAYREIEAYCDVVTIYKQLRTMTIGVIGSVFRGMFDFEYDKTKVKGALGPEVLNIQIDHLLALWRQTPPEDAEVRELLARVPSLYEVAGVGEGDLLAAARIGIALKKLVARFRLDGVALLGQHFVEAQVKAPPYLGLAELHREGRVLGVTEGDVIGLIAMKILRYLAGKTPFFLEWGEYDLRRNAWMLLGHGFSDPTQGRKGQRPRLTPTPEQWGLEGTGCSVELSPEPGVCTITHMVEDARGWRMLITGGEILDLPSMPIHDTHALVRVERPIKEFVELLTKAGLPHHAMMVRGDVRKQLGQLANLMGMEKTLL